VNKTADEVSIKTVLLQNGLKLRNKDNRVCVKAHNSIPLTEQTLLEATFTPVGCRSVAVGQQ